MNEIDDIKLRKLQEMQQEQMQENAELQQKIQQLEMVVRQVLTKDALERYGNIKAAYPDKAVQLLAVIGQAMQEGKVQRIDDAQLKELLMQLAPKKKEFNLKFK